MIDESIRNEISAAVRSAVQQETAALRAEIDRVDDWANGVFSVLLELLPPLLKTHPEIAAALEPKWKASAERYEKVLQLQGQSEHFHESPEHLEARKMAYRVLLVQKAWPSHSPE